MLMDGLYVLYEFFAMSQREGSPLVLCDAVNSAV
jgi:hypothetical protein